MLWFQVIGILIMLGLIAYLYFYLRKMMTFFQILPEGKFSIIVNLLLAVLIVVGFRLFWNLGNLAILHLMVISFLVSIFYQIGVVIMKPGEDSLYVLLYSSRLLPILLTAVVMSYGVRNMNHIIRTEYKLLYAKLSRDYKIAMIADTHYGTIQDGKLLEEKVSEINAQKPDLVVLAGDIVEEGTSNEEMREVFATLGRLKSTYGTYFIFGNHDPQNYTQDPSYTVKELIQVIKANGITVLQDQWVEIGDDLVLVGRKDAGWNKSGLRLSSNDLLALVDQKRYIIMADHQPLDTEENSRLGVDLQLSGHTHAGQIFPIGVINTLRGDLNYGDYQIDGLTAIVTSGFTGWGYSFRTQEHCEYVMVDLVAE